jgi:hypothetical protein
VAVNVNRATPPGRVGSESAAFTRPDVIQSEDAKTLGLP